VVVPLEKLDKELDEWCQELIAKSPSCLEVLKSKREERNGTEGDPGN
jgi:1,4-dihydroxy-2-naphthoyl-CoA synthase